MRNGWVARSRGAVAGAQAVGVKFRRRMGRSLVTHYGRWLLYVNGKAAGSIANAVAPGRLAWGLRDIEIGPAAGGAFDEWRLSRGVLSVDDLLFRPAPGFTLLLR